MNSKIEQLICKFCEAAINKGDYHEVAAIDHKCYEIMRDSYLRIVELDVTEMEFAKLLNHSNSHVRMWVATELLTLGSENAKEVLIKLRSQDGLIGQNTKIALKEYEAGNLKSPFGRN